MRHSPEQYGYKEQMQEQELILRIRALKQTELFLPDDAKEAIKQVAAFANSFDTIVINGGSRIIAETILHASNVDSNKIVSFNTFENGVVYKHTPLYEGLSKEERTLYTTDALRQNGIQLHTPQSLCIVDDRIESGDKAEAYLQIFSGILELEPVGYAAFSTPGYSAHRVKRRLGENAYFPLSSNFLWDTTCARLSTIASQLHPENPTRQHLSQRTISDGQEAITLSLRNIYEQLRTS